jgi:hypothetical protein
MPKLLLVELIERVCRLTIIREIPGITDCFSSKEKVKGVDGKPDREVVKVSPCDVPHDMMMNIPRSRRMGRVFLASGNLRTAL